MPTTTLPGEIKFGTVSGRILLAVGDTNDADRDPDAVAAQMDVTFTPSIASGDALLDPVSKVIVLPASVTCSLDSDGYLVDPQGAKDVRLVATNSSAISPAGWQWKVAFRPKGASAGVVLTGFGFDLPEDTTVDLSRVARVASSNGTPIIRGPQGDVGPTGPQGPQGAAGTPGVTDTATSTAVGLVELATVTEARAGTDTARAVTPAGLAGAVADEATARAAADALLETQMHATATYAPLASPAFTGTPIGITKAHVGLGNVDNTSDANKPVSTAQAAAFTPLPAAGRNPLTGMFHADGYGAKGDGTTNDAAAIQAALTAAGAAGGTAYLPSGTFTVATGLTLPVAANLTLHPSATIKATASMSAILSTPTDTKSTEQQIRGGTYDCNSLASDGIALGWFQHLVLADTQVRDWLRYGYKIGDAACPGTSYELSAANLRTYRSTGTIPTGSAALYLDANSTDHQVHQVIGMGGETGVINNAAGSYLSLVHVWCRQAQGNLVSGFDEGTTGTNSTYVGCYADTPTTYGFRFRGVSNSALFSPAVFNNPVYAIDNTATAFYGDGTPRVSIYAARIQGGDASHRIAYDYRAAVSIGNLTSVAATKSNVTNTNQDNLGSAVRINGNLSMFSDSLFDIGSSNASRPRTGFFGGGLAMALATKTASYTIGKDDGIILASGSGITLTLPAAPPGAGRFYILRNTGTSNITVAAASGTVDMTTLAPSTAQMYVADGTNWFAATQATGRGRQRRASGTATVIPSATAATYGTAVTISPPANAPGLMVQRIYVQAAGTFASETLTMRVRASYEDGTTGTGVTKTFVANGGNSEFSLGDFYSLSADGLRITALLIDAQSTIASSAATGSYFIAATGV